MDITQKLIVGLLVLSILFSLISIGISYSASQIHLPDFSKKVSGNVVNGDGGGLTFYVENANTGGPAAG